MAQTNFTPISLYYSTTAAAVPVNTNLVSGELAINITDGKLFYKDNSGVVQTLATKAGVIPSPFTANGVVYASSSSALATGSALTFNGTNLVTTGSATGTAFIPSGSTVPSNGMYLPTTNTVAWSTNTTECMRLDSSGNLGLGVTPSAWAAGWKAFQTVGGNSFYSDSTVSALASNAIYDGAWKYVSTAGAGTYQINRNAHNWYNAPSGTAGNAITFTQAMTLDASGNLLVGTTSVLNSGKLSVDASGLNGITCQVNDVVNPCFQAWSAVTSGNSIFVNFATEGTFTSRGSISYNRAGGLTVYNTTSDYRAKEIIGPVQDSGATIDALKVYEGQMKGATQSRPMLIAHEAQAVTPYAVTGEKDAIKKDGTPDYQQMDVSSLVPLLIAEVQSLRIRIAQLEAK